MGRLPTGQVLIFLAVLITVAAGCAVRVAPWERGYLAKSSMALAPYPMHSSIREHVYVSKEASSGGYGGGGGGCGCN